MPRAINLLMRKQGIITHWQKDAEKNPPKEEKRIRRKGQRQKKIRTRKIKR
jgi:hypothetical protein